MAGFLSIINGSGNRRAMLAQATLIALCIPVSAGLHAQVGEATGAAGQQDKTGKEQAAQAEAREILARAKMALYRPAARQAVRIRCKLDVEARAFGFPDETHVDLDVSAEYQQGATTPSIVIEEPLDRLGANRGWMLYPPFHVAAEARLRQDDVLPSQPCTDTARGVGHTPWVLEFADRTPSYKLGVHGPIERDLRYFIGDTGLPRYREYTGGGEKYLRKLRFREVFEYRKVEGSYLLTRASTYLRGEPQIPRNELASRTYHYEIVEGMWLLTKMTIRISNRWQPGSPATGTNQGTATLRFHDFEVTHPGRVPRNGRKNEQAETGRR